MLCPETGWVVPAVDFGVVDVVRIGANLAGPAEPCCAAALPATDAAGDVVLYMLNLPYYRPVRWVLGRVSFFPASGRNSVGLGTGPVDDHGADC